MVLNFPCKICCKPVAKNHDSIGCIEYIFVGCIYRHPCMELSEFNNDFFTYICEKLLCEKDKDIVLMGDFNVDSLKYENDVNTADFLDKIYSTSVIPQITSPTRITPRSKTLIDNIFSTDANADTLSRNIVTNISDHLAQFLSFPLKQTPHKKKNEIYKRNYKNFNVCQFVSDLRNIDWHEALKIKREETNASFIKFFDIFELLSDSHAPLKKTLLLQGKISLETMDYSWYLKIYESQR